MAIQDRGNFASLIKDRDVLESPTYKARTTKRTDKYIPKGVLVLDIDEDSLYLGDDTTLGGVKLLNFANQYSYKNINNTNNAWVIGGSITNNDFQINRYDSNGTYVDTPFSIDYDTGAINALAVPLTDKQIAYGNASNVLTGNANFVFDYTNEFVGIGETTPTSPLHIKYNPPTDDYDYIKLAYVHRTAALNFSTSGDIEITTSHGSVTLNPVAGEKTYIQSNTDIYGDLGILANEFASHTWKLTYAGDSYWNLANQALGLGTNSPTSTVHVEDSGHVNATLHVDDPQSKTDSLALFSRQGTTDAFITTQAQNGGGGTYSWSIGTYANVPGEFRIGEGTDLSNPDISIDIAGYVQTHANTTLGSASSDAHTVNGTLTIAPGTQAYEFGDRSGNLYLQGQSTGLSSGLELYSNDGDGTDDIASVLVGKGLPASLVNRERLITRWNSGSSQYEIFTEADGTGTLRPLVLYTEGNTNQLKLNTDGSILINPGTQAYEIGNAGTGELTIQSQNAAVASQFSLYSNDGDGTDDINIIINGVGAPGSANLERGIFKYKTTGSRYEIFTAAGGTGTIRPLVLYTGSNTDQLHLATDGKIGIGKTPTEKISVDFSTADVDFIDAGEAGGTEAGWIEVRIGTTVCYLRGYSVK